ncbi:17440_t:CDS:2 [Funneliformis caledonium]|uniref:17440_t:CDS:1 n=1 Tax=Funneliformis caledonium TaxID=1117310 RepID=A0A9N9AJH9_9GLOM|nr:17440_t:CDS:2 [Funneliformis caledonium]
MTELDPNASGLDLEEISNWAKIFLYLKSFCEALTIHKKILIILNKEECDSNCETSEIELQ